MPPIVADTTWSPGAVALRVPVVVPSLFVGCAGWVSAFPSPVAERVTVAPGTGLSNASRAVTVIVLRLDPLDAVIAGGAALTSLFPASTAPGVAVAPKVTGLPLTSSPESVAATVLAPAFWPRVHPPTVATPSAPVTGVAPVSCPPPPVTLNVTGMPASGLPFASRTSTAGGTATAVATGADCASSAAASIAAGAPTPTATAALAEANPSAVKESDAGTGRALDGEIGERHQTGWRRW